MESSTQKIVALVSDLMFTVKIQDGAKRAGLDVAFVNSEQDVIARARQNPALIVLDLNHLSVNPLRVIEQLKNNPETSKISILGFVSHVQTDLQQAARDRGCDAVIPRSAFSKNLPEFLTRYAAR